MKKLTICKMLAIFSVLLLNSCQNESNDLMQDVAPSETFEQKQASPSEEELLQKGWKLVEIIKPNQSRSTPFIAARSTANPIPLTEGHLLDIGYDINTPSGRDNLKRAFGKSGQNADGIWFNSILQVDANTANYMGPQPNVQISLGTPRVSNKQDGNMPDEVYTTIATNQGNTEAKLSVSYSYKEGYKTNWQRKTMGSFKLGVKAGFEVPLIGKGEVSAEVLVGGETANGTETSNETTKQSSYTVTVPPRSTVEVKAFTKIKTTTVDYTIPFTLTGSVRTNFNPTVDGHYFWSGDISNYPNFLPNIKSEMGTVKSINYVEVHVVSSPAKKI